MRRLITILAGLVSGLLLLLALVGAAYQAIAQSRDRNRHPPLRFVCLMAILLPTFAGQGSAQLAKSFAGASAGMTLGELRGPGLSSAARFGGTAGVFGGLRPTRNLVLNLGANWVQKGGEGARLDYVEFPLTIGGVALIDEGVYRSRFYTGLTFGVRVKCSSQSIFSCSEAASTEWAWPIGILVGRWGSGSHFWALDIRYTHGLSDAFEGSGLTNRTWHLRLLTGWRMR